MQNTLSHFEILCSDIVKAKRFYQNVFNWKFDEDSFPGYSVIRTGAEPTGGFMLKPPETPNHSLNVYFQVESIDAILKVVKTAGGTILVSRTEIPGVGYWGMFADPDGIVIGILEVK